MFDAKIKDILYSNRLVLRKFNFGDSEAIFAYGSDSDAVQYLHWKGVEDIHEVESIITNFYLSRPGIYAIALKDTNYCIGCIDLQIDEDNKKATFGFVLNRQYWNKGYMSEALQAVIKHSFEDIGLDRIEAHHVSENPASGKVMKKCGMVYEGTKKKELKGVVHDVVFYGITKEMWRL